MTRPRVLVIAWLPEGAFERLRSAFPSCDWIDGRDPAMLEEVLAEAEITYGVPPIERLPEAACLRWIQLTSAGVPGELCGPARQRGLTVTNLAGLYGPTIAEHTFGMLLLLGLGFAITSLSPVQLESEDGEGPWRIFIVAGKAPAGEFSTIWQTGLGHTRILTALFWCHLLPAALHWRKGR